MPAEFGSPEPVAQNDYVPAAWRVLLFPKDASECRSCSDDLEEAGAHGGGTYCSRGTHASERELPEAAALIHGHALERLRISLPAVELAWGQLEESTARCPGEDPHQPFRLLEGQGAQQDCVHDAEDCGVGADPKRQHADDRNGERRSAGYRPERRTKIGRQRTHLRISC
jgi:hypothetical protein